jgi:hypothetical protein
MSAPTTLLPIQPDAMTPAHMAAVSYLHALVEVAGANHNHPLLDDPELVGAVDSVVAGRQVS